MAKATRTFKPKQPATSRDDGAVATAEITDVPTVFNEVIKPEPRYVFKEDDPVPPRPKPIKKVYQVRVRGKDNPPARYIADVHDECEAIAAFCKASNINSFNHDFRVAEVVPEA